jgi:hypothetical protein
VEVFKPLPYTAATGSVNSTAAAANAAAAAIGPPTAATAASIRVTQCGLRNPAPVHL